ncbi:MAG: response regulator [Chloroflexi bacterium]|nr:response regulator [Chloroflexota bacterium]
MSILPTVLIVENDQATYRLYRRALQPEFHVLVASYDDDVLALVNTHSIDAIVLEPGPIGGRGWTLLSDLKRLPALQAIPIVLCTAQDERRRGLELGSAAYLIKPVLPTTLLETVRRFTHPTSYQEA